MNDNLKNTNIENLEKTIRIICHNWLYVRYLNDVQNMNLYDYKILVKSLVKKVFNNETFNNIVVKFDKESLSNSEFEDMTNIVFKLLDTITKKQQMEKDFTDGN